MARSGVNLAEIARTVQSALTGQAFGSSAKTDFAELGGTFDIVNGVLTNTDLKLLNPLVRLSGQGIVDIGGQGMKYRIEPKAVASSKDKAGNPMCRVSAFRFSSKDRGAISRSGPIWKG